MNLIKCKNGCILMHDADANTYWLVTEICGRTARLFAGVERDRADEVFNQYSN